jgi:predicted ATPase
VGDISNSLEFNLEPTMDGGFIIVDEWSNINRGTNDKPQWKGKNTTIKGELESKIKNDDDPGSEFIKRFFQDFKTFHFDDTSDNAPKKWFCNVNDNSYLKDDAGNLAAFLFAMKTTAPKHFHIIERTIQSVAPFFKEFDLKPNAKDSSQIKLEWREKGHDTYFDSFNLSDGTLRFICLATLLLQPNPPGTIIIDEPELGLHPFAIEKLAALIKSASEKSQIIITTQSINLLDQFSVNDIIVVDKPNEQSQFRRLNKSKLESWLKDYSLGQLWDKNILGGRPQ